MRIRWTYRTRCRPVIGMRHRHICPICIRRVACTKRRGRVCICSQSKCPMHNPYYSRKCSECSACTPHCHHTSSMRCRARRTQRIRIRRRRLRRGSSGNHGYSVFQAHRCPKWARKRRKAQRRQGVRENWLGTRKLGEGNAAWTQGTRSAGFGARGVSPERTVTGGNLFRALDEGFYRGIAAGCAYFFASFDEATSRATGATRSATPTPESRKTRHAASTQSRRDGAVRTRSF
jgi:hypothetical protein